jgi:hypothetical protein
LDSERHADINIRAWRIDVPSKGTENESISPIPVTEKFLIKLGFKKSDFYEKGKVKEYELGDFLVYTYDEIEVYFGALVEVKLKYVHQLQNFYFALTGIELVLEA